MDRPSPVTIKMFANISIEVYKRRQINREAYLTHGKEDSLDLQILLKPMCIFTRILHVKQAQDSGENMSKTILKFFWKNKHKGIFGERRVTKGE